VEGGLPVAVVGGRSLRDSGTSSVLSDFALTVETVAWSRDVTPLTHGEPGESGQESKVNSRPVPFHDSPPGSRNFPYSLPILRPINADIGRHSVPFVVRFPHPCEHSAINTRW